jgi:hypothetical protein
VPQNQSSSSVKNPLPVVDVFHQPRNLKIRFNPPYPRHPRSISPARNPENFPPSSHLQHNLCNQQ